MDFLFRILVGKNIKLARRPNMGSRVRSAGEYIERLLKIPFVFPSRSSNSAKEKCARNFFQRPNTRSGKDLSTLYALASMSEGAFCTNKFRTKPAKSV